MLISHGIGFMKKMYYKVDKSFNNTADYIRLQQIYNKISKVSKMYLLLSNSAYFISALLATTSAWQSIITRPSAVRFLLIVHASPVPMDTTSPSSSWPALILHNQLLLTNASKKIIFVNDMRVWQCIRAQEQ